MEPDGSESDARASDSEAETDDQEKEIARLESLNKLENPSQDALSPSLSKGKQRALDVDNTIRSSVRRRTRHRGPDAVIVLKEEKVSQFTITVLLCY